MYNFLEKKIKGKVLLKKYIYIGFDIEDFKKILFCDNKFYFNNFIIKIYFLNKKTNRRITLYLGYSKEKLFSVFGDDLIISNYFSNLVYGYLNINKNYFYELYFIKKRFNTLGYGREYFLFYCCFFDCNLICNFVENTNKISKNRIKKLFGKDIKFIKTGYKKSDNIVFISKNSLYKVYSERKNIIRHSFRMFFLKTFFNFDYISYPMEFIKKNGLYIEKYIYNFDYRNIFKNFLYSKDFFIKLKNIIIELNNNGIFLGDFSKENFILDKNGNIILIDIESLYMNIDLVFQPYALMCTFGDYKTKNFIKDLSRFYIYQANIRNVNYNLINEVFSKAIIKKIENNKYFFIENIIYD